MVLLFARSNLYAERAQRPGIARIVSALFLVTLVSLIFALVNGQDYSSYYIFYGTLFFAVIIVGSARWAYELITGALLRAAGYRRRAVLVGSGRHIEDVAHALRDEVHVAGRDGRLHLAHAAARTTACARSAGSRTSPRSWTSTASRK